MVQADRTGNFPMPVKFALAVLALVLALGPLGLLQAVAWTGMAFDYSARYGLADGLGRTFDGNNPCGMCEKIAEARTDHAASDSSVVLSPSKLVFLAADTATAPVALLRKGGQKFFELREFLAPRPVRPASPPPRALAA